MNREIKFKIYDKNDTKAIIGPFSWNKLPNFDYPDNFVILQYTGLKDKNGKEIYEGDILLYRNKPREVRFGEFWNGVDDFIGFFIQSREITHRNFGTSAKIDFTSSEIIGNIFENPELIKKDE